MHRDYGAHVLRWNFIAEEISRANGQEPWDNFLAATLSPVCTYLNKMFFRYGWITKQVKQGMKILDVGCGQDQPLLYVLGARIQTVPELYVGVDLNRIMRKSNVRWAKIYDEFDFTSKFPQIIASHGEFDVAVNFEVIEHMSPEDGRTLLAALYNCLKPKGCLYLSTPVFDGMAAANHIHEYTIPELHSVIVEAGFDVEHRYGTFASKPDIRHAMFKAGHKERLQVYDDLEHWFGGDVMSTFMAPLYPDSSRNNLWVCRKP